MTASWWNICGLRGMTVEIISLPWRNYAAHLTDNFHFRLPPDLDLLIQDELNHPSLLSANAALGHIPLSAWCTTCAAPNSDQPGRIGFIDSSKSVI